MDFEQNITSEDSEPMPGDYFPTTDNSNLYAKRLGGFDIYKSERWWQAIVVVEATTRNNKRSIKWFRWESRGSGWKVGLCNMKVDYLNFDDIKNKIQILKKHYQIK